MIFDYTVVMRPHIDAGKLRALAISRADRLKTFPDVPTFKERGVDIELTAWASIAMPAGTPPDIVIKMSAAMADTMRDPTVVKYFEENDFGNLGHLGSAKLQEFYIGESEFKSSSSKRASLSISVAAGMGPISPGTTLVDSDYPSITTTMRVRQS